jgi:plasmid stabilization system protein ParE
MNVIISERAEKNLQVLADYLKHKWSIKVWNKFLLLLEKKMEQLAKTPNMYEASGNAKGIRRCVVTSQTILYYRIKANEIEIITIQDSRKNPKKLKI